MGRSACRPYASLPLNCRTRRLSEYEQSAHFPYLEEPDRFATEVIGFLAEGKSQGASDQRDQNNRKNRRSADERSRRELVVTGRRLMRMSPDAKAVAVCKYRDSSKYYCEPRQPAFFPSPEM